VYKKFSPAAFDLIISGECHRSIYNKFSDVLAYFDAIQIGLTATPAHFISRRHSDFEVKTGITGPCKFFRESKADFAKFLRWQSFQKKLASLNCLYELENTLNKNVL